MGPYRSPQVPPEGREPPEGRDWARAPARLAAVALPLTVVGLVIMKTHAEHVRCGVSLGYRGYMRLLWGAPGLALVCSLGVAVLLLLGARFSPRR